MAVLQIQLTNPSAASATLTSLVLNAFGNGDDLTGINSIGLWLDTNGDGALDAGDTLLGTAVYNSNNGTATFPLNVPVADGSGMTLLLVDIFSASAPDGIYQTGINAGGLGGTSAGGAVQFTGLPVSGAIITIAHATGTPTSTPTPTATPTHTLTHTWTLTPTPTRTPTHTSTLPPTDTITPIPTDSMTPTITRTFTPVPAGTPLDTANQTVDPALPATVALSGGTTVSIPAGTFTDSVTLRVYEYAAGSAPATSAAFQVTFMPNVFIIEAGGLEPLAGSSVTITLPYNPADIPGGYTEADLALSYFDGNGWVTLPATVDAVNHTVTTIVDHFSWWAVVLRMHTPTPTPTPFSSTRIPILFPNPSNGGPVNILPPITSVSDVKVQIFSMAFRKVNETTFPQVLPGVSVSIALTDWANQPLANGLYYVLVETDEGRSIAKLMVIR